MTDCVIESVTRKTRMTAAQARQCFGLALGSATFDGDVIVEETFREALPGERAVAILFPSNCRLASNGVRIKEAPAA